MRVNRSWLSGLAAVGLMGGLLTPVLVAPTAQAAATITVPGVTCTANYNGGDINADPGDVLSFTGVWTNCTKITVLSSIVDDSTAISATATGPFVVADQGFTIVLTTTAPAHFQTLEIRLKSQPVARTAFAVLVDNPGSGQAYWAVSVGSAPNPNPPAPIPADPPTAPTAAAATPGSGEVTVAWQAPTSQGSFPVTNYQVQSTPSSSGCLTSVAVTTCRITGLRNGTAYTFQIRALNGGGWGPWADTAAVIPRPNPPAATITISGSRVGDGPTIRVRGTTTGLVGTTAVAWLRFPGQSEFRQGSSRVVNPDGTFEWTRKTAKRVTVYFQNADGSVRSNRVIIPAR